MNSRKFLHCRHVDWITVFPCYPQTPLINYHVTYFLTLLAFLSIFSHTRYVSANSCRYRKCCIGWNIYVVFICCLYNTCLCTMFLINIIHVTLQWYNYILSSLFRSPQKVHQCLSFSTCSTAYTFRHWPFPVTFRLQPPLPTEVMRVPVPPTHITTERKQPNGIVCSIHA